MTWRHSLLLKDTTYLHWQPQPALIYFTALSIHKILLTYSIPFPYPSAWLIGHFVCMERWTFSLQNQETCDRSKSQPLRFPEFLLSWNRNPHPKLCFPDALFEWAPPIFWVLNLFSSSGRFVKYLCNILGKYNKWSFYPSPWKIMNKDTE